MPMEMPHMLGAALCLYIYQWVQALQQPQESCLTGKKIQELGG